MAGDVLQPSSVPQAIPAVAVTPARLVEAERVKPDLSFRINDSFKKIGEVNLAKKNQETSEKGVRIEARDSFTENQLIAALEAYIALHKPETAVAVALTSHKPSICEENVIIEVDNQLQLEKLELIKMSLQNALMRDVNNGFITLAFKFFDNSDGKEEEKLFTSSQKFEHFMKLNPVIAELKTIFGLELE